MTDQTPIFIRPNRVQAVFGIHRATLYRWAEAGHIKRGNQPLAMPAKEILMSTTITIRDSITSGLQCAIVVESGDKRIILDGVEASGLRGLARMLARASDICEDKEDLQRPHGAGRMLLSYEFEWNNETFPWDGSTDD